jgi:hypothetical protein
VKRIVMFSGGAGSWATARRVVEHHGSGDVTLLFADTLMEDPDLYRFLDEAAADVCAPLVKIAEGRDPWQVFFDTRFLGNTRIDPCSRVLKRQFMRRWLEDNCEPDATVVYLGIDWTEQHRFDRARKQWEPWEADAPLCEPPLLDKRDILRGLRERGVAPPALYGHGFPHNNCGGFCIKAGQAQFALLLREYPDRYAYHERRELELRDFLGKDVAILRDRRGGRTRPMTLREFRQRVEAPVAQVPAFDSDEWGGCGCVA